MSNEKSALDGLSKLSCVMLGACLRPNDVIFVALYTSVYRHKSSIIGVLDELDIVEYEDVLKSVKMGVHRDGVKFLLEELEDVFIYRSITYM